MKFFVSDHQHYYLYRNKNIWIIKQHQIKVVKKRPLYISIIQDRLGWLGLPGHGMAAPRRSTQKYRAQPMIIHGEFNLNNSTACGLYSWHRHRHSPLHHRVPAHLIISRTSGTTSLILCLSPTASNKATLTYNLQQTLILSYQYRYQSSIQHLASTNRRTPLPSFPRIFSITRFIYYLYLYYIFNNHTQLYILCRRYPIHPHRLNLNISMRSLCFIQIGS